MNAPKLKEKMSIRFKLDLYKRQYMETATVLPQIIIKISIKLPELRSFINSGQFQTFIAMVKIPRVKQITFEQLKFEGNIVHKLSNSICKKIEKIPRSLNPLRIKLALVSSPTYSVICLIQSNLIKAPIGESNRTIIR